MWAFATLDLMTPQLKQRMEDRALDPQVLSTFSQQDIAPLPALTLSPQLQWLPSICQSDS